MTYPIIAIPDNAPELPEQQGTKTKYWLHLDDKHYLFKIGRENTGENWAEVVACALCELLGLPPTMILQYGNSKKALFQKTLCQ